MHSIIKINICFILLFNKLKSYFNFKKMNFYKFRIFKTKFNNKIILALYIKIKINRANLSISELVSLLEIYILVFFLLQLL